MSADCVLLVLRYFLLELNITELIFYCLHSIHNKIRAMEQTLGKIKKIHDNCSGAANRLRTTLHSTEERLQSHKKEANYLAQIAAKSLPKGLHCLPLRLTNEYYSTNSNNKDFPYMEKLEDPKLYHYALFSDNVLAATVVVNSTLVHAKVYHLAYEIYKLSTGLLINHCESTFVAPYL